MYSAAIAAQLRRRNHDVIAVLERADLAGETDDVIFAAATTEGRAIVTKNIRDYIGLSDRALSTGRGHPGLLLASERSLPRGKAEIGAVVLALERVLRDNPAEDSLRNQLLWLP